MSPWVKMTKFRGKAGLNVNRGSTLGYHEKMRIQSHLIRGGRKIQGQWGKKCGNVTGTLSQGTKCHRIHFFLRQNVTRTFCGWTFRQGIIKTSSLESMCTGSWEPGSRCRPNECYFWMWETPGGRDFGIRDIWARGGKWGVQFTSNQRPRWTDPVRARRVSK